VADAPSSSSSSSSALAQAAGAGSAYMSIAAASSSSRGQVDEEDDEHYSLFFPNHDDPSYTSSSSSRRVNSAAHREEEEEEEEEAAAEADEVEEEEARVAAAWARRSSPSSPSMHFRPRSSTMSEALNASTFVRALDRHGHHGGGQCKHPDLAYAIQCADGGLKAGMEPILADGVGGTYMLRDRSAQFCIVVKPGDEEANSENNPHQYRQQLSSPRTKPHQTRSYKGKIVPGFCMYREVAACLLDGEGFSFVPPTQLVKFRHKLIQKQKYQQPVGDGGAGGGGGMGGEEDWRVNCHYKLGSAQLYVKNIGCAEDFAPSLFDEQCVQRIAVLDIRVCNLDRHEGNLLVCPPLSLSPKGGGNGSPNRHLKLASRSNSSSSSSNNNSSSSSSSNGNDQDGGGEGGGGGEIKAGSAPLLRNAFLNFDENDSSLSSSSTITTAAATAAADAATTTTLASESQEMDDVAPPSIKELLRAVSGDKDKYRLLPIDHGFILPSVLAMSDVAFAWLHWPSINAPLSPPMRAYIASLNVDKDIALLQANLGTAICESSLLTLRVCTMFLQRGTSDEYQLTLKDIALAMCGGDSSGEYAAVASSSTNDAANSMSPLQSKVFTAIQKVVHSERIYGIGSRSGSGGKPSYAHVLLARTNSLPIRNTAQAFTASLPLRAASSSSTASSHENIVVNDESLSFALMAGGGKYLFDELASAIDDLCKEIAQQKQKQQQLSSSSSSPSQSLLQDHTHTHTHTSLASTSESMASSR